MNPLDETLLSDDCVYSISPRQATARIHVDRLARLQSERPDLAASITVLAGRQGNRTAMLWDDESTSRLTNRRLLESCGCDPVIPFGTPRGLLRVLESAARGDYAPPPHIIVSDMVCGDTVSAGYKFLVKVQALYPFIHLALVTSEETSVTDALGCPAIRKGDHESLKRWAVTALQRDTAWCLIACSRPFDFQAVVSQDAGESWAQSARQVRHGVLAT